MLHVRAIVPAALSEAVRVLAERDEAVTHLVVLPGVAQDPAGDVVEFDVVREGASTILDRLRELGIAESGSISVEQVDLTLSAAADKAAEDTPGLGVDAVVWHELEQRTGEEAELSVSFLVFMAVATVIAAIGVLLDQPILIVGSMVVGPEFGPLAGLSVGLVTRKWRLARRSVLALVVGFPAGMIVAVLSVRLLDLAGLVDRSMLLADRPLTDFIWRPDALSWVVGFLGGIAGLLSLTSAKAGTLVGVLISVTTVPAAANAAVALAYGVGEEAAGSALQLVVNVVAIVVAGVLTLLVQRLAWRYARPRG